TIGVQIGLAMINPAKLYRAARSAESVPVLRSLAEGFRYATRTPSVLWPLVLLGGISIFGLNFQTLLPLYAVHTLGLHADGYGALYAVMGVGSLIGSMSLAFLGQRRPLVPLIIGGGLIFVTFELLLGGTRSVEPAYIWVILKFQTLLPLYAVHTLGLHADGYGALYAVMGVGSLIGSMSLAFLGQRRPLVPLIIGGGLIFVTFELLLGGTRSVEPAYIWVIF